MDVTWSEHTVKIFLAAIICLINFFRAMLRHLRFSMVEQLQSRLAKIGSKRSIHLIRKTFPVFHIYSVVKKSQEKSCLPNCFTINIPQVTEEILSPTTFVTKWTFIGYCKTSAFFWLIFSVSSPPSLTTMRFPHSSSMNTSLR